MTVYAQKIITFFSLLFVLPLSMLNAAGSKGTEDTGFPSTAGSVKISPLGVSVSTKDRDGTDQMAKLSLGLGSALSLTERIDDSSETVCAGAGGRRARSFAMDEGSLPLASVSALDSCIGVIDRDNAPAGDTYEYFQQVFAHWKSSIKSQYVLRREILWDIAMGKEEYVRFCLPPSQKVRETVQFKAATCLYNADLHKGEEFFRGMERMLSKVKDKDKDKGLHQWEKFQRKKERILLFDDVSLKKVLEDEGCLDEALSYMPELFGDRLLQYKEKEDDVVLELGARLAALFDVRDQLIAEGRRQLREKLSADINIGREMLYIIARSALEENPHSRALDAAYFLASSEGEDRAFGLALLKSLKMPPFNDGEESFLAAGDSDEK